MAYSEDDVLYFPSIEFRSTNWLKASLLVWDHVYRIVPADYQPQDNRDVRAAIDSGLIRNIALEDEDRSGAFEKFSKLVQHAPFMPHGFRDQAVDSVHTDKIDSRLYPLLENSAALLRDDWYVMSRGLARGYMLALATEAARRRSLCIATDSADAWTASAYLQADGNFDERVYAPDQEEQYCHALIDDLLPLDLSTVSMSAIVNVREKHDDERRALREEINRVLTTLARCESAERARHIQNDICTSLRKRKSEYKSGIRSLVGDFKEGSIIVGVPTTLTALSIFGGSGRYDMTDIGGALAVGAIAAVADATRARNVRRRNQIGTYLVNVEAEQGSASHIPHLPHLMNEFVND